MYAQSDDASQLSGPNMLLSTSVGNYYAYACLHTSTMNRRKVGWNLCEFKRGDHYSNVGSMTDDLTILDVVWQFTPTAGASFDLYFSDAIKDFYAKPQVTVWFADNLKEGYTNGFPTCRPAICRAAICRPRTIWPRLGRSTDRREPARNAGGGLGHRATPNHRTALTSMTEAEMRAEVEEVFAKHRKVRIYLFRYVLSRWREP